ncbi:MAG TPA: DUF4912 domain-containing protein [Candidatus Krumholzibacteria bacterium]|nr:DUF4912 domain-containing protein [Candidatus Krumholzibacteria bacterium]
MPEAAPLVPVPAGLPPSPERPQGSLGPPRPEAPRETAGVDQGPPLPSRYGVDRLVLLVRDPHWSYAWWEVREDEVERARRDLAEPGRLVLRFYDVSAVDWDGRNHHSSFDIEVHDLAGNWYVELGRPGADFVAELGLRGADGRFLPLVRSNFVAMPRDAMSPQSDAHWIVEEEHYRRMFELSGGEAIGLGSGEILRALEERLRRELIAGGVSSFGISSLASRRQP